MKNIKIAEAKVYKLFPVGKLTIADSRFFARILKAYRPALKYLELFSHAVLFLKPDKEHNHFNYHNSSGEKPLHVSTAKIIGIDEKEGIIELDCVNADNDTVIFDIKPYFPCEDRVKAFTVSTDIDGNFEWRQEAAKSSDINKYNMAQFPNDDNLKGECSVSPIGSIRNNAGVYQIHLNNDDADILKGLTGFSHIKILWWFDRFDKSIYRKATQGEPPYENAPRTGIFATRSPVRPNPIAMTTARIIDIDLEKGMIRISKLDCFDKTPVIDIIPYIPVLDRVKDFYVPHWLKHWPEWLDDREESFGGDTVRIMDSDIDRLNKLTISKETDIEASDSIFTEDSHGMEGHPNEILVKGARQNNLKNISFSIPKNKITVVTGVSGSGKSSLAFDTIYAESQRRFIDSMIASGRALFEQLEKPDFDEITGLPPAIAVEQKTIARNPRSTVGTLTDIYDYIRLLYAKIGIRHCPECERAIIPLKPDEIIKIIAELLPGTAFGIRPFNADEAIEKFVVPKQNENDKGVFFAKVKTCVKKALELGSGAIFIDIAKSGEFLLQTKEICYHCSRIFFELTTSTFSFNNPESMCPVCKGLGVKMEVDADLIISDPKLSILDGASQWWGNLRKHRQNPNANWMKGEVLALAEEMGVNLELPWEELPESFKKQALYGSKGRKVKLLYENSNGRKGEIIRPVEGAFNAITRLFQENSSGAASRIAMVFIREKSCSGCNGERLAVEGRLVSIGKTRFPEMVKMTIEKLRNWVHELPKSLSKEQLKISLQILKEIDRRLKSLVEVGVPYLTLDRAASTLSGGEAQRIRLATLLGNGITNVLYVLDEPSIGLHPRDHKKLIKIMEQIRDAGNTVLVVEHDADTMLAADKIIDIGPGAGIHGGYILAEGTPEEIMEKSDTETGNYLKGMNNSDKAPKREHKKPYGWVKISRARHNNLKNIDVEIPLGVLTCITGVSGSGKSSLINKTLHSAIERFLNSMGTVSDNYDEIHGLDGIDNIISISQQPIGRTPRSNPATYTGVFDEIRKLFAETDEARSRGYKQSKFSFNSKDGQCETCGGEGRKCVQMHFMPDVWIECSVCHGKRYNAEALEIKHNGKTIADVLDMTIEEALEFFKDHLKISHILQTISDVGLGYIKLGQSALTLSGGEAQRIKLSKELSNIDTGKTIYLLDEPTTGLHFSDVQKLLEILHRITEAGNTVIVIEHNIDIMKNADWIIDLGPEGGDAGGYIIAKGTPEEVAEVEDSYTGRILKEYFA